MRSNMTSRRVALFSFFSVFIYVFSQERNHGHPLWLINLPHDWNDINRTGILLDVSHDNSNMTRFQEISEYHLVRTDAFTDGEHVDAMEHFFWGKRNGIAMELGALDGSPGTRSMTHEFENSLGWRRILVEGDPKYRFDFSDCASQSTISCLRYRPNLIANSPKAFGASAAICQRDTKVHYTRVDYVGGIVEFMGQDFMKEYHKKIYGAATPPGNISSLDWKALGDLVVEVDCIPLSTVLHKAHVHHINFFILDVEGGEMEVLRSINWAHTRFDVLCIETEATNRPPHFADDVTEFLLDKGYVNATAQTGRNIWYTHRSFVPSARPGLAKDCFNV